MRRQPFAATGSRFGALSSRLVSHSAPNPRIVPLGLLAGAVLAAFVGVAASSPAASKYMRVEDVKPGMKGWGQTVLSGTKPTKFDVEIISTLHNFRPGQDLFIIKTIHPRLQIARTVAGMSGSPIYIGDKMIGAYAYGWFFSVEPIAGVTPIHNMLDDLKRPIPPALLPANGGSPLPPGARNSMGQRNSGQRNPGQRGSGSAHGGTPSPVAQHRFNGKALDYDLRKHASQVAERTAPALRPPSSMGLRPATTDVMVGGLGPAAFKLASEILEPIGMTMVQAGGGGGTRAIPADAPTQFVDGGAVSVQLVRGDISLSGLGTVTHVVGDKLVAFGHPMLNGGIEDLPTAIGTVHWILSTQNRSFKLGEPLRPLGSLVNDRQASIVIDTKRVAPTFPVTVSVDGALVSKDTKTSWYMEVAHDQFLAPSFAAVGIGSAVETVASERSNMTWRAVSTISIEGKGKIRVEDFGAGNRIPIGPSDISRSRMVRALGALLNNPWRMARITGVDTKMKVSMVRDTMTLRGAQVLESELDPGKPARIRLTLVPHLGQAVTKVVEVPLDAQLAGTTVRIKLRPGYRADRIVPAPESFDDLVRVLPKLDFPAESVVASYDLPGEAAASFRSHVATRLPPHAADTLRSTTQSVSPVVFKAGKQVVIPTKGFVVGSDTVEVKVRQVLR
jgi:hypothetical protein